MRILVRNSGCAGSLAPVPERRPALAPPGWSPIRSRAKWTCCWEAGNMLAKQLTYLAGADAAGIVLGARVPIILTSRADNVRARLASVAVMKLATRAARPRSAVS